MSNFEIVTREDFSDVTYLLEIQHPLMAQRGEARAVRDRHVARAGRAHPAHHRRLRPRQRHDHAGDPGGRQDDARNAADVQGRHLALRRRRPDGHPEPDRPREEGDVRRRRARRRADLPAGARVQGKRRLRDRRPRLSHQGPDLLGGQVPRRLRRSHPLHRRRLGGHQGQDHRRHQARDREARRHRRVRRDRPAGHDEGRAPRRRARTRSRPW